VRAKRVASILAVTLSVIAVPATAEARAPDCFPNCGPMPSGPKCDPGDIWHPDADGMGGGWCERPKKCTFWWRCPKSQSKASRRR
jgi:hypothetical protein